MAMTRAEKIALVKTKLGDTSIDDALVGAYVDDAEDAILERRYPSGRPEDVVFPERYDKLSCRLAERYYLRRGAEGETVHSENGINREYGSANDDDLLSEVVQIVGICG